MEKQRQSFNDRMEKFMDRLFDRIERFEAWTAPYAKLLWEKIKSNKYYLVWFAFYFFWTIVFMFPFFKQEALNVSIVIYGASFLLAYVAGDTIICLLEGTRPSETRREKEYLNPLFEEVYMDVKEQHSNLPKLRIHIIDTLTVNAIAIGRKTIAVTQGAIETFNQEELKGVIAHEMSHIYYGDTKATIINTIGNGIFTLFTIIIKLILKGMEYIAMKYESVVLQAVFRFIRFIFEIFLFFMCWIGSFILALNSRGNEFKADKFAFEAGYEVQLIEALYLIQKMNLGAKAKLVTRMMASHPRVSKRIEKLEKMLDEEDAASQQ